MLNTSDKIVAYRHRNNMTQEQVAQYLNISTVTYRTREEKPETWRLKELHQLSALFNVSMRDLMADEQ